VEGASDAGSQALGPVSSGTSSPNSRRPPPPRLPPVQRDPQQERDLHAASFSGGVSSAAGFAPVQRSQTAPASSNVLPGAPPKASAWSKAISQSREEVKKSRKESMQDLAKVMQAVQQRIAMNADAASPARATANAIVQGGVPLDAGVAASSVPVWDDHTLAAEARARQMAEEQRYMSAFSPTNRAQIMTPTDAGETPHSLPETHEITARGTEFAGVTPTSGTPHDREPGVPVVSLPNSEPLPPPVPTHLVEDPELPIEAEEKKEYQWKEQYVPISCACYPRTHRFRISAVYVMEHVWFDRISMFIISCNCVTLAMYDAEDEDCNTDKCQVLAGIDLFFGVFFTLEMIIKMIAMGVYGKGSYLSSGWNRLDFVIVVSGLPDFVPGLDAGALSLMRIMRVMRPLRAINRLPSLRVLIKLIFETLPMLGNVVLLVGFIVVVFSILGVQLFMGSLSNRCYNTPAAGGTMYDGPGPHPGEDLFICSDDDTNGMAKCAPTETTFGIMDPGNFTFCRDSGENPNFGVISYDDFIHAFVVTFLVMSMEGWTDILYMVQDAYSFWTWIYFYALVLFGSLLTMNLFLVIVSSQFSITKAREKAAMQAELEELARQPKKLTRWEKIKIFLMDMLFGRKSKRLAAEQTAEFQETEERLTALKMKEDDRLRALEAAAMEEMHTGDASQTAKGSGAGAGSGVEKVEPAGSDSPEQKKEKADSAPEENKEAAPEEKKEELDDADEEGRIYDEEGNRIVEKPKKMSVELIRWHVRQFVNSPPFNNFIMACICINTCFMASEHYEQPASLTKAQEFADFTFNFVYILELVLKLYGLGLEDYVSNPMNLFDGVLVLNSVVEMAMGGGGGLAVLRTFRLMRIFKLFRFLPGLQTQVSVLFASLGEVANFCVILLLFMFVYAVLGMYLFGAKFRFMEDDGNGGTEESRSDCNFDDMYRAFVTVFQLLTIEDWPGVMFDAVRATSFIAVFYFVSLIIFGNYILCNLFIAILLDSFAERAKEKEKEEERLKQEELMDLDRSPEAAERLRNFRNNLTKDYRKEFFDHWSIMADLGKKDRVEEERRALEAELKARRDELERFKRIELAIQNGEEPPSEEAVAVEEEAAAGEGDANDEDADRFEKAEEPPKEECEDGEEGKDTALDNGESAEESEEWTDSEEEPDEDDPNVKWRDVERSCCIFPPKHPLRRVCKWIVDHPTFDKIILGFIIANSLAMAFERPSMDDDSTERQILNVMGYVFNTVFLFEATFKIIAWGLYYGKEAYLKDGWNVLDGFLVFISMIDMILTLAGVAGGTLLRILKIMRLLRALRPLRVINKAPKLKRVVGCMIESCKSIGNTLLICGLVFLIFGILSIQLFGGKLWRCVPEDKAGDTKADCIENGGTWTNAKFNYDNLWEAMLTLFYVVSFDGWVDIMYTGVSAKEKYVEPEDNYAPASCMFFIIFLVIGNFFVLNLFVGVIVDSFNNSAAGIMAQDNSKTDTQLVEEKREEDELERKKQVEMLFYLDYPPDGIQRRTYDFVISRRFEIFITVIIVVNVLFMAIEHNNQPSWLTDMFTAFNYVFTVIFFFEMVLKIIGFGFQRYLCSNVEVIASSWNRFDFFLVWTSFAGLYFDNAGGDLGVDPTMLRVLRVFRIARIMKLLKQAKGLKALLDTVSQSLAQVASIGMLLALAFFIYSCAAVQVFGLMDCECPTGPDFVGCNADDLCDGLSDHAHFQNWPYAMLTLFRICTGDAGASILSDAQRSEPQCDADPDCEEHCCAQAPSLIIPLFFMSFTVLAQFIMLNVVVAVLMGQLDEENNAAEAAAMEEARQEAEAVEEAEKAEASIELSKLQEKEGEDNKQIMHVSDESKIVQESNLHNFAMHQKEAREAQAAAEVKAITS